MVETAPRADGGLSGSIASNAAGKAVNWASWRNLWQVPVMLLSVGLIGLGLYTKAKPATPNDFDGALGQVEELNEAGEFDLAGNRLRQAIEPHLDQATAMQQARFHAAVADCLFGQAASAQGQADGAEIHSRIAKHYSDAEKLGLLLSSAQRSRWAQSAMAIDDIAAAQSQLAQLDAMAADVGANPDIAANARATRNTTFRQLVEAMLRRPAVSFDELMTTLAEYRMNGDISAADEIWAIARQTELRLRAGGDDVDSTRQATDLLLVELRRLENRDLQDAAAGLGELYTLLGRGYFELGEYPRAQQHLERAMTYFAGPEEFRGEALVLLGHMAMSNGDPDAALEHFQIVIRDFVGTPSHLPGLLGHAEAQSILGSHLSSLSDFRLLCDRVKKSARGDEVSPDRVAEVLCDRCDAALALNNLDRALEYAALAEELFSAEQAPAAVLIRLASVHRQMADRIASPLDPAVRYEANTHYEKAGDYFLRHANAAKSSPSAAEEASMSLWLAADSFDLGGRQDLAIQQFNRYLDMHAIDDSRRAEVLYRLAQAHHATLDFESAAVHYERVITEHARSSFGAQSYVPLARCYIEMKRIPEARQQLQQILSGGRLVNPQGDDYRDALVELGRLEYASSNHTAAIEALAEFLQRYPSDARATECKYLLADSYRSSAQAMSRMLKDDAGISPTESGRLNALSAQHLQTAHDLFAQVVGAGDDRGENLDGPKKNEFDSDLIRRAAFYQADCAFELGQFEHAIQLYDHAARQYSAHQSSMYALVQIVNSYSALGDTERAAAAHHRALVRLKQLPDNAFLAPDALMDRAAWERWLEHTPVVPDRTALAAPSGQ